MIVIGHGNVHGVNPISFFRKQLAPVRVCSHAWDFPRRFFQVGPVHITERYKLSAGMRFEVLKVIVPHTAYANTGVTDFRIRRNFSRFRCGTTGKKTRRRGG
jgi:hypothetical protein